MIYFARRADTGLIKIGKSDNVSKRLSIIALKENTEVVLVKSCNGSFAEEKHAHKVLAKYREHGEWFKPAPEVMAFIDGIDAYEFPDFSDRTVRLTTSISDELNDQLKRIAKADGRTLDRYVARLLEAHAKRVERANEQA